MEKGPPGCSDLGVSRPRAPDAPSPSTPATALARAVGGRRALEDRDLRALSSAALHHTGSYQRALLLAFLVGGLALPFGASPLGWAVIVGAVALGLLAYQVTLKAFLEDAAALGVEAGRARRLFDLALSTRRRLGQRQGDLDEIEEGVERALLAALKR